MTIYTCILFIFTKVLSGNKLTHNMLNNATGEQWKILRTVISPTFSTGKLKLVNIAGADPGGPGPPHHQI